MAHVHDYDTIKRISVSSEIRELGIERAEMRRCKQCECETIFLEVKGKWVAMHEECVRSEQDILLA